MFHKKTARDVMHERARCPDEGASYLLPIAAAFLNHANSFHGRVFKLNAKCDADSLLYSLSHFECDGHTVDMLTQQCLPPPLTSAVQLSLFTHVHSSPLSLAAGLHRCCANRSCYIQWPGFFQPKPRLCNQEDELF